jgi:uncharacterized protein (TIGR03435 family)
MMVSRLRLLGVLTLGLSASLDAQSFEVATVKPTPAEQQGIEQPSIVQFLPNGFRRTNSNLRTLVRTAYDIQEYQVIGGPGWADRNRFDIEARHSGSVSRSDALRMLQHLLEDRFKLRVSRATKEGPTYDLTRIAGGKLPLPASESTSASVRFGDYSGKRSMPQLAQYLSSIVGRPVTDRTGLTGNFDLHLSFAPDLRDADKPSIFAAVQEQLGLRLESARGPVDTITIESAELPAEN